MSIYSSRRTLVLGFCLLACGLGGPLLAATPDVSIKNKFVEISVEIDNAFKAYPGLFDNCLTEGKSWAQKSSNDAAKEQRSDPSLFRDRPKWSYDRSYTLRSVVARYVSIVRADDTYEGGAHPNHVVDTILWDGDAQKRISVRPFFTETADNGPTMTALARLARLAVAAEKISRDIPAGSDDKLKSKYDAGEVSAAGYVHRRRHQAQPAAAWSADARTLDRARQEFGIDLPLFALRRGSLRRRPLHGFRTVDGIPAIPFGYRQSHLFRNTPKRR